MAQVFAKGGNYPSIKGPKAGVPPRGAAVLELGVPLALALGCHSLRPLFFFFFFFFNQRNLGGGPRKEVHNDDTRHVDMAGIFLNKPNHPWNRICRSVDSE
eukprot:FR742768.1.p2 GENE.FR742768.1~~FR742768.1.p2  ORF type:complete len:101 (-),score=25.76 FR742768.1:689-991(-)